MSETPIITVGANKKGRGGIPYRAVRASHTDPDPELGVLWFFEYLLMPDPEWRPRGAFYEKDGVFKWGEREFPTAYAALEARVASGP